MIDRRQSDMSTGHWVTIMTPAAFELGGLVERPGRVADGVFLVPPALGDILGADGLWSELGAAIGAAFAFAEEADIPNGSLPLMAAAVRAFARDRYAHASTRRVRIGKVGCVGSDVSEAAWVEATSAALRDMTRDLATFIDDVFRAGDSLIVSV